MNRISGKLTELKKTKRKALIPYITAGDPNLEMTATIMQQLVASGADILEIGMAFSDPVADGPVIQAAHQRALKAGLTLNKLFNIVGEFRQRDQLTPIVLMSYLNPIETMGYDNFVMQLMEKGIDGVLIVDLPPEEGTKLTSKLVANAIAPIFLIAPTTLPERTHQIASQAKGFLYVVSLKGVTGSDVLDVNQVEVQVSSIKQSTDLPLAIGFGIRDGKSAAAIAKFADAVIVGSAYVSIIEQTADNPAVLLSRLSEFTQELRAAIDAKHC